MLEGKILERHRRKRRKIVNKKMIKAMQIVGNGCNWLYKGRGGYLKRTMIQINYV